MIEPTFLVSRNLEGKDLRADIVGLVGWLEIRILVPECIKNATHNLGVTLLEVKNEFHEKAFREADQWA